jgi:hypothetical protein
MVLLLELLLELVLGTLFELAFEGLAKVVDSERGLPLAIVLLVGAFTGLVFSVFFPSPLLTPIIPGSSLLLSPLILGVTMHLFGRWRALHDHLPTSLATFTGGAVLGFGIAGARLLAVLLGQP